MNTNFPFKLSDLINEYMGNPRKVDRHSTRFSTCLCLEPDPVSVVENGAYLIIIEPCVSAEGEAKVYGNLCENELPDECYINGYQSGFTLSICKYDITLPDNLFQDSKAEELRGFYSAHYFDVFEHSLENRWDKDFLSDNRFCNVPQKEKCVIALAMVYIRDGNPVFLDQWIPRRLIATTQSDKWAHTLLGAPSHAAAIARVNQFQCMLKDNLERLPGTNKAGEKGVIMEKAYAKASHSANNLSTKQQSKPCRLWVLNIFHPFGFLPIEGS